MSRELLQTIQKEAETEQPYIVRGHHIRQLVPLHKHLLAAAALKVLKNFPENGLLGTDLESKSVRFINFFTLNLLKIISTGETTYKNDVLGSTSEQKEHFVHNYRMFLGKYLFFKGDLPVYVTQNEDEVCQGCAVGDHCRMPSSNYLSDEDAFEIAKFALWLEDAQGLFETRSSTVVSLPFHTSTYGTEGLVLHTIATRLTYLRTYIAHVNSVDSEDTINNMINQSPGTS